MLVDIYVRILCIWTDEGYKIKREYGLFYFGASKRSTECVVIGWSALLWAEMEQLQLKVCKHSHMATTPPTRMHLLSRSQAHDPVD